MMSSALETPVNFADLTPMRKARAWVLQILYGLELAGTANASLPLEKDVEFELKWIAGDEKLEAHQTAFVVETVSGILVNLTDLDVRLQAASPRWKLSRMGVVDRCILRFGAYELLFRPWIGMEIVLNEAVELAKTFGDTESSRFINGILQELAPNSQHINLQ